MYKTPIFIDFDGTLFDTALFREQIYDVFIKSGYDMQDIRSSYIAECMDYKYSPEGQFKRLLDIKHSNDKLVKARLDNLYAMVPKYIYPDVGDFLRSVDRSKYEVDALTLGDLEFQTRKLESAGFKDLLDNFYVTDKQKWEFMNNIVRPRDYFIFIDDRADTLENIKQQYPKSLCIQIIRQDLGIEDAAQFYKDVYSGIKIHNLSQALRYLAV